MGALSRQPTVPDGLVWCQEMWRNIMDKSSHLKALILCKTVTCLFSNPDEICLLLTESYFGDPSTKGSSMKKIRVWLDIVVKILQILLDKGLCYSLHSFHRIICLVQWNKYIIIFSEVAFRELTILRQINIQWDGHEGHEARSNLKIVACTKLPILQEWEQFKDQKQREWTAVQMSLYLPHTKAHKLLQKNSTMETFFLL